MSAAANIRIEAINTPQAFEEFARLPYEVYADREAWFAEECRRELRRHMIETDAQTQELAGRFDLSWRGLARYWRKREPKN